MKKVLINRCADFLMLALAYMALIYNGEHAIYFQNMFLPIVWILIVLTILSGLMIMAMQDEFKGERTPKGKIGRAYSASYDLFFGGVLLAFGFAFTGVFWLISSFISNSALNKLDDEIIEEKSKDQASAKND